MNRVESFGQNSAMTWVDRFGVWLSIRQIMRWSDDVSGSSVCDAGSGYHARIAQRLRALGAHVTAVDVALDPGLRGLEGMECVEGVLPGVLDGFSAGTWDLVLCVSVLEHLWEPGEAIRHFHRMLAPGGVMLVNVPSWRGKRFLEYSAFRLGLSPKAEMDDHKMYYDTRDIWPLLVSGGFLPSNIRCFPHKFGLNTFAVCRKEGA